MLDMYLEEQPIVTSLLQNSIKNNRIVQAYLFYCNDINYILTYAKQFSKEIITLGLDDIKDSIFDRIDKNIYSELKIIEPQSNVIKKEQLIELQNNVKNKPVEGNKIIYIIKNCDKLNLSSANSMLKFLEEPEDDIIAILLTDNIDKVLPTIKSRCQIINFNTKRVEETGDSYNTLKDIYNYRNEIIDFDDFKKKVDLVLNFVLNLESKKINTFIQLKQINDCFKSQSEFDMLVSIMINIYIDALYLKIDKSIKYMKTFEENIREIAKNNSLDDIINKIYICQQVKYQNTYNVNIKLLIDKIILELGEI